MSSLHLDPDLAQVVARARHRAEAAGELDVAPISEFRSPLSTAARQVLAEWLASGEYRRAVRAVIAEDPELADE